jgi:hypothetical protein
VTRGQRFIAKARSRVHSRGGMWTHFPDHLTYRFTEVRPLA